MYDKSSILFNAYDTRQVEGYQLIEVKNLTKRYGQHIAVNNISFRVEEGEIVGFLGPNGAGKTTTMNILTGFISATEGDAFINGCNILDEPEKAKRNIGYLPDNPPLYGDMTVREYLHFVCDIKSVRKADRKQMLQEIMAAVKITDMQNRLVRNLSKGYRQRVGLAQALVGFPKVLILDEPTVGLDPKQIIEMRDMIKRLGKKHTIMLSSHILSEVSAVCDRVMIINKGTIVASDTSDGLSRSLTQGHKMLVRVKGEQKMIQSAFQSVSLIREINLLGSREAGTFDFELQGEEFVDIRAAIFACLAKNNLPILLMKSSELTLEEIFLRVTTGEGGVK